MNIESIERLIKPYLQLPLECDGFSRIVKYLLDQNNIPNTVYAGILDDRIYHVWVEVDGLRIDYRARMWAKSLNREQAELPHGITPIEINDHWYSKVEKYPIVVNAHTFMVLTNIKSTPNLLDCSAIPL